MRPTPTPAITPTPTPCGMRRDQPLALAPNAYRLIAGCERRYEYAEPLLLFPEIDGVRIVGPKRTELLRRVADATEGALRVGSRAPAARLIAASEAFDEGVAARTRSFLSRRIASTPRPG